MKWDMVSLEILVHVRLVLELFITGVYISATESPKRIKVC